MYLLDAIDFCQNYNNKLSSKCFTTIRLERPNHKYKVGMVYHINLHKQTLKKAKIVEIRSLSIHKLTNWHTMLDMGYNVAEGKAVIQKMYPKENFTYTSLLFILLQTIEPQKANIAPISVPTYTPKPVQISAF